MMSSRPTKRNSSIASFMFISLIAMGILATAPCLAQSTADALRLDLTQDGLDAVARELQSRFLQDVDGQRIEDIRRRLKNGWHLESHGLEYSVGFRKLDLRATSAGIRVDFAVQGVEMHADSIEVSKPFLWWDVASKCSGVDIKVSGPADLALSVLLLPSVTPEGALTAEVRELSFAIDEDAYQVKGPIECSGILGLGRYMRQAVSGVLSAAREQVAEIVKQQVVALLPESIQQIDAMLHQSFELHVGYPGVPFAQDLILTGAPAAIELHEGRLVFVMRSEISALSRPGFLDSWQRERRVSEVPRGTVFGSVGLNKKVINDALEALHPMAQNEFEIDPSAIPQLGDYLNAVTLSSVWPDLQEIALDGNEVRVFISCPGLPNVQPLPAEGDNPPDERAARFAVNIPDARIAVMVRHSGGWMRYATLDAGLVVPLKIDMMEGELAVELNDLAVVDITGAWADDYEPVIDIFEADLARVVVKSLLEMVYLQGPFLKLLVPVYDFGGGRLGFSNPQAEDPFFTVDLIAARR